VQLLGTELMLQFIGDPDGTAAPRLANLHPDDDLLRDLWRQTSDAVTVMAQLGLSHGDLSPYNVLVHHGRLVVIDLPQVVDVVANPQGRDFLVRDVTVMARWFTARGLPESQSRADLLLDDLLAAAGIR
jgi:RIO kinase 1